MKDRVPNLVKSGVNPNSKQGPASLGNLQITRQFLGFDSWEDALGGLGDLAKTVGGITDGINNGGNNGTGPKPPPPPVTSFLGGLAGSPMIIGGAALVVVAVLYFALRKK